MSNKKQTAVEYLTKEFSDILGPLDTKPMQDLLLVDAIKRALEMESKKQQKYDEMIEMLDECLNIVGDVPLGSEMSEWYKNAKQLIKEAKKL